MATNTNDDQLLSNAADKLVSNIAEIMRRAKTEEDLRIGFEKSLEPILKSIGIEPKPIYESLGIEKRAIYHGRPDAIHGKIIIEYEPPNAFGSESAIIHAYNQLKGYIIAKAKGEKTDLGESLKRIIGIGFDGKSIFFVKYSGKINGKIDTVDEKLFILQGPFDINQDSTRTLLTYLRALARLPLSAMHLADKFGPKSKIAPIAVSAFVDSLEHWGNERTKVFFNEWKRLFGIVYGEQFSAQRAEEARILSSVYGIGKEIDFQKLLFSVHTYFALLMKFIAAEIINLKESALAFSYSHQLTHSSKNELLEQLTYIENGGIYAKRGITNFLEGDFFQWYLDAFSPRLEEAIREIARGLSEFEPATNIINPEYTHDLLKKLYQYLMPQEIRHKLGEYYTPDWLAELILDEVGYDGNITMRLLDPACGSGTFIALAIQRAKEYGKANKQFFKHIAKYIKENIWGFDLNPLAVIAARTNYLFALGDLLDELENWEIPIYLADSILWPEKTGQMQIDFIGGEHVKRQTSIKLFHVPYIWIKDKGFLMRTAAPLVEEMAKQHYSISEAMDSFSQKGLVFPPHEKVVENFYQEILELEKHGQNGIWARFLKNAFAPLVAGQFDFVVGNPPWIRLGYLSREYRDATLPLWQEFGLYSLKGHAARLGGGEKDFSMLFTYAASHYYLKKGGKLGFLITQEVFKSKGAGEGFRRFRIGDKTPLKVLKAHDLVSVKPFEGAANKTAAIILKKDFETKYPVPYIVWNRKKGIGKIPTDIALKEALPMLQKKHLKAQPIGSLNGSWQTISASQKELIAIKGNNFYQARRGASTEPYGVFWLKIKQILSNGDLIIQNLPEKGKRQIPQIEERIESDLVFPAVRGADIQRWFAKPEIFILMSQDPKNREPFPEQFMKKTWPRTYGYLARFKDILLSRGSNTVRQFAERTAFYAMFGIGPYTMARYKVVLKRMANDLVAAVISQEKTSFGYKIIIPTDTTSIFSIENENEAHYICAIINSIPVREFIKSYSSAGRGFGAPSVMNPIGIKKFDSKDAIHVRLSQLSKRLHDMKAEDNIDEIANLEKEIDKNICKLFSIKID